MSDHDKRQDIHNSDTPVVCRSCEVRHRGVCGVLSAEELSNFARHTRQTRLDPGVELVGEAEPVTGYGTVMRGVVKLTKTLRDGRQQVVGLQFAPDFVGRLRGTESRHTAETVGEVDICRIPRAAFEAMIEAHPGLERRIMEQNLRELDEARDWLATVGRKSAAEKVASFLHLIATHSEPNRRDNAALSFELPLTRADIADFLGLTIETVSRQLTKLRADGVIAITNNRQVEVPDLSRLENRCG